MTSAHADMKVEKNLVFSSEAFTKSIDELWTKGKEFRAKSISLVIIMINNKL